MVSFPVPPYIVSFPAEPFIVSFPSLPPMVAFAHDNIFVDILSSSDVPLIAVPVVLK